MNDFLLTLFFLLVVLSLYSLLVQRKKIQQTPVKNQSSELSLQSFPSSTSPSKSSELSSDINTSETKFQPSRPPEPDSSLLSPTSTLSSQSNYQSLAQNIQNWGDSNSSNNISPILNYLTHCDPSIRVTIAQALGKLVSAKNITPQVRQAILALGRLSRDRVLSVRLAAVEALSKVKSPVVIPFLKVAQKDNNSRVVKNASAALNNYKGYPSPSQKKVPRKPKNVVKQLPST